jgi:hypothetical protein
MFHASLPSYGHTAASQSSAVFAVVSELSAAPRLVAYAPEYVKGSAAATSHSDFGDYVMISLWRAPPGNFTERSPKYDQKITTTL